MTARAKAGRAGLLVGMMGLCCAVQAQTAPGISAEQLRQIDQLNLSRERIANPLPTTPRVDLRILAPEKSPVPKAVDELEFTVAGVEVEGDGPHHGLRVARDDVPVGEERLHRHFPEATALTQPSIMAK